MTPRDILAATIRRLHAQGYQYIPEPEGFDAMSRLLNDEWDTRKEFEARGGGDCFPLAQRIICRHAQTGLYALPTLGDLREDFTSYEALSYDFEALKWTFRPITACDSRGVRPVVEVRLRDGSRFRATSDHRVWTWEGYRGRGQRRGRCYYRPHVSRLEQRRLIDINLAVSEKRRIVTARQIPSLLSMYDSTLAYLDGIYAAEGYVKQRGKRAVEIAQDKLDIRAKIERALDSLGISYHPSRRMRHASYSIHASDWSQHFLDLGADSFSKRLPMEAMSSSLEVVGRMLEGHRDGDGFVPKPSTRSRHYETCEAILATSSDELKRHLVLACMILGKPVTRWLQQNHMGAGKHPIWRLTVRGEKATVDSTLHDYPGLGYSGIRSLEPAEECEVADVTVEGTHNFVLDDGVIAHNCDGWVGASIEICEETEAELPHSTGDVPAAWYAVEGWVPRRGEKLGHMWVALDTPEGEVWADPTWNIGPAAPEALGYREDQKAATRWPVKRWRYKGWGQFGDEMRYGT